MNNIIKALLPAIVLTIVGFGTTYLLKGFDNLISGAIVFAVSFATVHITFRVLDHIDPAPKNLTLDELKSYLVSKTFWFAFLIFIATIVRDLFSIEIDQETVGEIVDLDWSNILQALLSAILIMIRKIEWNNKRLV